MRSHFAPLRATRPSFRASQSRSSGHGRRSVQFGRADRPGRRPAGCPAKAAAAVPSRAPGRGRCCAGPALFQSAWKRRCAASARRKSCARWPLESSRSRERWKWWSRRSRCRARRSRPAIAIGPAASAITRFDGVERVLFVVQRDDALALRAPDAPRSCRRAAWRDRTRASAAPVPP